MFSLSKSMDIPEYLPDILLTAVMVISTLILILRFWQDLIIAIAATLMMLSLGGLFLSLEIKVRNLEKSVITRERMLRTNLEEISRPHEREVRPHDLPPRRTGQRVLERGYK